MRRGVRILLSLSATLLLLYFFLRGVDWEGAWKETREARPGWLGVCLAGAVLHYVLRAVRWKTLLAPAGRRIPFGLALSCTLIGYFLSAVLPGRPGELARPLLLAARTGVSRSYALATILLERAVLDPLTLLVLLALALIGGRAAFELTPDSLHLRASLWAVGSATMAALAVGLPIAAWALARRRRILDWLRDRRAGSAGRARLVDALERFAEGLAALGERRVWPGACAGSLLLWASVALGLWGGMRAFGADVGYLDAIILSSLAAVGVAVPTPGGAGGFHLAIQFGLMKLYGVPLERSVPAALFTHLLLLLPALTFGAWAAWRHAVELASLNQGGSWRES